MKYERLAFVTGPARSGTTLVGRMLSGGSNHRHFPECGIITSAVILARSQHKSEKSRFDAYFGTQEDRLRLWRQHCENLIDHLLRNEPSKSFLFLKDPNILDAMEAYRELFPEAPILIVVRNPIDVLASRCVVAQRQEAYFALNAAIDRIKREMRRVQYYHRIYGRSRNVHLVRYERLGEDPAEAWKRLADLLGVELEQSLVPVPNVAGNVFATHASEKTMPTSTSRRPEDIFSRAELDRMTEALNHEITFHRRVNTLLD